MKRRANGTVSVQQTRWLSSAAEVVTNCCCLAYVQDGERQKKILLRHVASCCIRGWAVVATASHGSKHYANNDHKSNRLHHKL
jgi:hypothetical protein